MAELHIVTAEYPPQPGGVSDYVRGVAAGLAAAGERVHVWCPPAAEVASEDAGVEVHRELGRISRADLRRMGALLDAFPAPRRLLVQWVPHAYGFRAMNLGFCLWVRERAARGDRVEIMVHEPFLAFGGSARQGVVAAVHRAMTVVLLGAAERVWVSTPAWAERWRKYRLGRTVPFEWTPIPSNVPVVEDADGAAAVRSRYAPAGGRLIGHFGTYRANVTELLEPILVGALEGGPGRAALLLGRGGERFRDEVVGRHPALAGRVHSPGALSSDELSRHLAACDLLVQPYPDGVNGRQTSLAACLEHGRAVVTTEGASTEGVWRESGAVAMARVGDAEAAVGLVDRLLADDAERARLGAAAERLYDERFHLRHTIAALTRES
ncbi:MAG TPA: glycosyltransferase [Longimicrobiaceae bacterium]|jgi:glycosyltransferase involved in cell wall biosynthesis